MLVPAQLYKEELNKKYISTCWYNNEYQYFNCGTTYRTFDVPDNNYDSCHFVEVDDKGEVTGYFRYVHNWEAQSINNFGLISFKKNNVAFIRNVFKHIINLFKYHGVNRVEWYAYTDNPACKGYDKFIEHFGGRRAGYVRQVSLLTDGKLHDMVIYEILRSDIKNGGNSGV